MKNSTQCFTALLAFCCLFVSPLYAAKVAQVEICHYDFDKSEYKLISMSSKGSEKHKLNHPDGHPGDLVPYTDNSKFADDCTVMDNAPAVLARAYIDVDEDKTYTESDISIVEVHDVSGNLSISVGDEVIFGQFPANLAPCPTADRDDCDVIDSPFSDFAVIGVSGDGVTRVNLDGSEGAYVVLRTVDESESVVVGFLPVGEVVIFDGISIMDYLADDEMRLYPNGSVLGGENGDSLFLQVEL